MFLIIPLGIFIVTSALIIWLIAKKFVYLKKLEPSAMQEISVAGQGFWSEMYPEIVEYYQQLNLRSHGVNLLKETEKFLRKLRLLSLKIDSQTNKLINQVRKSSKKHENILVQQENSKAEEESAEQDIIEYKDLAGSEEELKQKEQLLIIEIAKNPKDAQLYKELGIIYMRLGDWEDAKQSFEKAIELDPADESIKRKLGRVIAKLPEKK